MPIRCRQGVSNIARSNANRGGVGALRNTYNPCRGGRESYRPDLRDLSSANFAVRQQAAVELEKSGEQAAHFFQEALKKPSSLEVKRRLETLLEKLERTLEDPGQIRVYRCLVLLERIGTPEARKLLIELSQGAPAAWLTTEAGYSLKRFQGR